MKSHIVQAQPVNDPNEGRELPPCIRRRDLGALGLTGAAALALAGCGPDRGGLKPSEVQADESGAVPLADLPEWSTTIVNFGGQRAFVAVVRGQGEELKGWEAYCTHQGCALTPEGPVLNCPCHGSTFDSQSGDVKGGPAESPLIAVDLKLVDGMVTRA